MDEHCEKSDYESKNLRFMFEGREVFEIDTPKSIGMKNGDHLDILRFVTSSCRFYRLEKIVLDPYVSMFTSVFFFNFRKSPI